MGLHGKMFKKNTKYKILTPDGFKTFSGVQTKKEAVIRICFSNNKFIDVTETHRFIVDGLIYVAKNLKIGDSLQHKISGNIEVTNIKYMNSTKNVYDPIEVKGYAYFGNDIVNHNCEFLGSINTVIDTPTLEFLFTTIEEPLSIELENNFRIYEKPVNGCVYTIGVDVAKGTGEHSSTVQVLKILSTTPLKLEQVAAYESNMVDVYTFSDIIHRIAIFYNNAYLLVENNADGAAVVNKLWWDLEYTNFINSGSKTKDLGIRATQGTKTKAVLLMKKLIEDGCLLLKDRDTVNQLGSFIERGKKFFGKDLPDDLVSALYWAPYVFTMDILDEEIRLNQTTIDDEGWGMLSDVDIIDDDFSWLVSIS